MSAPHPTWAVQFPRASAPSAVRLRLRDDVEIVQHDDENLLLRGPSLDEDLELLLRQIPGARRFTVTASGAMIPIDSRIPRGILPATGWTPLRRWMLLSPQPAAAPGQLHQRVATRLERSASSAVEEPGVLVTPLATWCAYAATAPGIRLKSLWFAASGDGRAVVRGRPLPPIAGERYVQREGLAVPCGLDFAPRIEPSVLRVLLQLEPNDLALFHVDGSYELVPAASFVAASRSSARLTLHEVKR